GLRLSRCTSWGPESWLPSCATKGKSGQGCHRLGASGMKIEHSGEARDVEDFADWLLDGAGREHAMRLLHALEDREDDAKAGARDEGDAGEAHAQPRLRSRRQGFEPRSERLTGASIEPTAGGHHDNAPLNLLDQLHATLPSASSRRDPADPEGRAVA